MLILTNPRIDWCAFTFSCLHFTLSLPLVISHFTRWTNQETWNQRRTLHELCSTIQCVWSWKLYYLQLIFSCWSCSLSLTSHAMNSLNNFVMKRNKMRLFKSTKSIRNMHTWIGHIQVDWTKLSKKLRHLSHLYYKEMSSKYSWHYYIRNPSSYQLGKKTLVWTLGSRKSWKKYRKI